MAFFNKSAKKEAPAPSSTPSFVPAPTAPSSSSSNSTSNNLSSNTSNSSPVNLGNSFAQKINSSTTAPPLSPNSNSNSQSQTMVGKDMPTTSEIASISKLGLAAAQTQKRSLFGEDSGKVSDLDQGYSLNLLQNLKEGEQIRTTIDRIVELIKTSGGQISFIELKQKIGLTDGQTKVLVRILSKAKVIEVYYPSNPFSPPLIKYVGEPVLLVNFKDSAVPTEKKLLETYTVIADFVVADVKIWSVPFENTPIYQVVPHKLSEGTTALILGMMDELVRRIPVKLEDITDPRKVLELKETFFTIAKDEIKRALPDVDEGTLKVLAGSLLHNSYGLGDMEIIMGDNWLEEVAINGANEFVAVYHRRYGWVKTTTKFSSENEIYNFSAQIGRKVGKEINSLFPIMDAHMLTGDRVAATLFPISTGGDTITIRRFSRNPWTIVHMVDPKNNTMSQEMMAFLWLAIQYELNVIVVGGTASGKTSVLNTLASLMQPTNRIISIEDTREISLPDALHWNWVPLNSRSANPEGQGEVSMLDLMVASLRMRPDRIIVGEIRRKAQAEAMFEAMHTGHSVYATLHADTAEQAKKRLTQPPIDIPENEIEALHLLVVQYRDRRRGIRRTLEIAELLPGSKEEGLKLNYLYRWRPRRDKFDKDSDSIRVIEDLNLHTGMTVNDLEKDLEQKKAILQWMIDNNIRDINKVGQIMRIYYKYPKLLIDTVLEGGKLSSLSGSSAKK